MPTVTIDAAEAAVITSVVGKGLGCSGCSFTATVNGSYLFLYDLNINPYLSPQNNNSTAYFTVFMETNVANLHAYTTQTDNEWNPINYTSTQEGSTQKVEIKEYSDYSKPLLGDLVVMFSDAGQVPESSPIMLLPVVLAVAAVSILLFLKRQKNFPNYIIEFSTCS